MYYLRVSFFLWWIPLRTIIVFGRCFLIVNFSMNLLHSLLQELMEPSSKILNHVMVTPFEIQYKQLAFHITLGTLIVEHNVHMPTCSYGFLVSSYFSKFRGFSRDLIILQLTMYFANFYLCVMRESLVAVPFSFLL